MKLSSMFLHTHKEDPKDAEVISHKLMLRAGMIKKAASGIYSYLPYGLAALRKVEEIVREEMNNIGGQEVLLPAVQPAELWEESGRWSMYGKELLRFKDRKGAQFAIGPTHEEVITALVRDEIHSYRNLPVTLYQIQTKFRDEIRPRFGLIRAREFIMKDAYSFDKDDADSEKSYNAMYGAYVRIFDRCGLKFRAVEAATGAIGGTFSHEFMVLADAGEDFILSCNKCSYAANIEKAEVLRPKSLILGDAQEGMPQKVHTPDVKTVKQVCDFLDVTQKDIIKTMIYNTDTGIIAALVRGDHEVNEVKLQQVLNCKDLELADEEVIEATTSAPHGFAGPAGLNIKIIADMALVNDGPFVTGANEEDCHLKGVWLSRDVSITTIDDIRIANPGDICPRCGEGMLEQIRGIEVGHIFKLGTKYSSVMDAVFSDERGTLKPIVMGCYGIGIGRTVAAVIAQCHDDNGIIFPLGVAPYPFLILPIDIRDGEVMATSMNIYKGLKAIGIDVLIDDRDERPGVKFKDADLIGVPYRITVGTKALKDGVIEIKNRARGDTTRISPDGIIDYCKSILKEKGIKY